MTLCTVRQAAGLCPWAAPCCYQRTSLARVIDVSSMHRRAVSCRFHLVHHRDLHYVLCVTLCSVRQAGPLSMGCLLLLSKDVTCTGECCVFYTSQGSLLSVSPSSSPEPSLCFVGDAVHCKAGCGPLSMGCPLLLPKDVTFPGDCCVFNASQSSLLSVSPCSSLGPSLCFVSHTVHCKAGGASLLGSSSVHGLPPVAIKGSH